VSSGSYTGVKSRGFGKSAPPETLFPYIKNKGDLKMMKIKCPKCGEPTLSRINHDIIISEHFEIINHTDYVIEGGEERRITYKTIETVEDGEHFIEELESNQLEFQCDSCGFFLNGITNEEEMIDFAEDNRLFVEVDDEN
jgi:predicted RNA-binding Zn-ribbon protein involved in translation (DUF1610 family)